jgi:hypothetical protein
MNTEKSEESQLAHCLMSAYFSVILFLYYWKKEKTEIPFQKQKLLSELERLLNLKWGALEKNAPEDRSKVYEAAGKLLQEFLEDTSDDNRIEKNNLIAFISNDILDQKILVQSLGQFPIMVGILQELERIFVAYHLVMQILRVINAEDAEFLADYFSLDQQDETQRGGDKKEASPGRDLKNTKRAKKKPEPKPKPEPKVKKARVPLIAYQPTVACHSDNEEYLNVLKGVHDEFLSTSTSFDRGYMEYLITNEIFPEMSIAQIRERSLHDRDFLRSLQEKLRANFLSKV